MKKMRCRAMIFLSVLFLMNLAVGGRVLWCYAETKLTASDAAFGDYFGSSVSISGNTAIVGAYGDAGFTGAAYIFTSDGTAWTEVAKLIAGDAAFGDYFGSSVSISGDTAVVGVPYSSMGLAYCSGAAYVFTYDGSAWKEVAKLRASDGVSFDFFGSAVSIHGDTVLVGATGSNGYRGSAYVFTYDGSVWMEVGKLTASDAADWDYFGSSVSLSENAVLVGAWGKDEYRGSAYVFEFDGTGWTQTAKLVAGDGATYDSFGNAVSISGNTAVVGAPFSSTDTANYSGAAYVFTYDGSVWKETMKLIATDSAMYDAFGSAVSISGNTALVGASGDEGYGGSAYIFRYDGTSWAEVEKLIASDAAFSDYFGASLSLDKNAALIGAPFNDSKGSAYVFEFEEDVDQEMIVDIKPGSCFNPLNPKSNGVLPVVVVGSETFDVKKLDPETLRLSREGVDGTVRPLRHRYEDMASPVDPETCIDGEPHPDGIVDLGLKFSTPQVVELLHLEEVAGQDVVLTLTGTLKEEFGGTLIQGHDTVKVKKFKKDKPKKK